MLFIRLSFITAFIVVLFNCPATALDLVRDGVVQTPIMIAEDAPPENQRAARELADYVEKISGVRPTITTFQGGDTPDTAIWVGNHTVLSKLFPQSELTFTKPEETLQICKGKHLALLGRDEMDGQLQIEFGTPNAVYTFIEHSLGVRWIWPGELGEDIPQSKTISISEFTQRYTPQFRMRRFGRVRFQNKPVDESILNWYRYQRCELGSARYGGGHAFGRWWGLYQKDHPEWFAMRGDKGRTAIPGKESSVKLCVSNPEIVEQWLKNTAETLAKRPKEYLFSATPNDGGNFCMCPKCRAMDALDGPEYRGYVALTDRYVQFWNQLARGLKTQLPDKDIVVGALAYAAYSTPPVHHKLESNIVIGFVGHFPVTSAESRAEQREQWLAWANQASMIWYRPNFWYWAGGIWGMPETTFKHTAEDFRFLAENRCVGLNVDTVRNYWATQGPVYYLLAKAAHNPYLNSEEVMTDYYKRGFGPAATYIEGYWKLLETAYYRMMERPDFLLGTRYRYEKPPIFLQTYTPELLAEAEEFLNKAASVTAKAGGKYNERVAFVRSGFEYLRLLMDTIPLLKRARDSKLRDHEAIRGAIANWDKIEQVVNEAGPIAMTPYSFLTNSVAGEAYMRYMGEHLGPPTEKMRNAIKAQ